VLTYLALRLHYNLLDQNLQVCPSVTLSFDLTRRAAAFDFRAARRLPHGAEARAAISRAAMRGALGLPVAAEDAFQVETTQAVPHFPGRSGSPGLACIWNNHSAHARILGMLCHRRETLEPLSYFVYKRFPWSMLGRFRLETVFGTADSSAGQSKWSQADPLSLIHKLAYF
jgi:hypothetical protein